MTSAPSVRSPLDKPVRSCGQTVSRGRTPCDSWAAVVVPFAVRSRAMRRARAEDVAERALREVASRARALSPRSRRAAMLSAHDEWVKGPNATRRRGEALRDAPFAETDADALAREHRFVRDDDEDGRRRGEWGVRLARRYHDALFKTFAICDLSRASEGAEGGRAKIGMRWRTEGEVRLGKGQVSCGERRCARTEGLRTFECHFRYAERGETKSSLVKLRVCKMCAAKLDDGFKRVRDKKKKSIGHRKSEKRKCERRDEQDEHDHEDSRDTLDGLL